MSEKARRNEGGEGVRLLEASPAEVAQGRAAAGKDHCCQGNKKPPIQPQTRLWYKQVSETGNEKKIVTARDGRYKGTALESRGQKARQVSRWAACRKYDTAWERRWSLSLQPLQYSLHKHGKQQTWCSGAALELRGSIRAGKAEEQPQTQGP